MRAKADLSMAIRVGPGGIGQVLEYTVTIRLGGNEFRARIMVRVKLEAIWVVGLTSTVSAIASVWAGKPNWKHSHYPKSGRTRTLPLSLP